jgi:hypothetical protein
MGQPTVAAWPTLEALPHWRDNIENVRGHKPDYPMAPRLAETIGEHRQALRASLT